MRRNDDQYAIFIAGDRPDKTARRGADTKYSATFEADLAGF